MWILGSRFWKYLDNSILSGAIRGFSSFKIVKEDLPETGLTSVTLRLTHEHVNRADQITDTGLSWTGRLDR